MFILLTTMNDPDNISLGKAAAIIIEAVIELILIGVVVIGVVG